LEVAASGAEWIDDGEDTFFSRKMTRGFWASGWREDVLLDTTWKANTWALYSNPPVE
jgi:hypothetical protein